ncbi:MAG: hypothetical protein GY847_01985 [Proteobacteria bacterium]|nr:hypothetical protein [Pseudomonadota bacterium]
MTKQPKKLKFAILTDGLTLPTWQASCVEQLLSCDFAELSLVIVTNREEKPRTLLEKIQHKKSLIQNNFLWRLFAKHTISENLSALSPRDMSERLADIPQLQCRPKKKKFSEYFEKQDVASIRDSNLDFILLLNGAIVKGKIIKASRYGIWSFHHGDERLFRGRPPAFWELVNREDSVGVILQQLGQKLDGGRVLYRGSFRLEPFALRGAYAMNLNSILMGAAHFPARVCKAVCTHGFDTVVEEKQSSLGPMYTIPSNRVMVEYGGVIASNCFRGLGYHHLVAQNNWRVGIGELSPDEAIQGKAPRHIQWLPNRDAVNSFHADPFALYDPRNEQLSILFEEYDFNKSLGRISATKVLENNTFETASDIIDIPGHLSYPFLFEHESAQYCVPETYQQRQVQLYKATDFPTRWTKVATLIDDFPAVDSTLYCDGKTWWLFCTNEEEGDNTHLYLWYADTLEGPWRSHPLNPVKCHINGSRPAGPLFTLNSQLYRPAQNCTKGYGGSISINKIVTLSKDDFLETPVSQIHVDELDGIHTIGFLRNNKVLIDGLTYAITPKPALRALRSKLNL